MTATEQDIQRVALVTGASRGIGAACAAALHHDGYRVAVHYRRDERLASSLCDELTGAVAFKADLAQENASEELVKSVKGELGRIDVLVNNAGTVRDRSCHASTPVAELGEHSTVSPRDGTQLYLYATLGDVVHRPLALTLCTHVNLEIAA